MNNKELNYRSPHTYNIDFYGSKMSISKVSSKDVNDPFKLGNGILNFYQGQKYNIRKGMESYAVATYQETNNLGQTSKFQYGYSKSVDDSYAKYPSHGTFWEHWGSNEGANIGDFDGSLARRAGKIAPSILSLTLSCGFSGVIQGTCTILNMNTIASEMKGSFTGKENVNILRDGLQNVAGEKTGAITFDVIDIGANGISSFNGFSKITKLASEKPVIESIKTGANSIIDLKSAEDGVKNLTNDFKK